LVPLAFFAILGVFKNPAWSIVISIVVFFSVLSDTLVIFMLPFAIWRILSVKGWWARLPSIALAVGAIVHVALVDTAGRETRGSIWDLIDTPSQTLAQLLVRGPLVTQIGMTGTQDSLWHLGVIPSVLILLIPAILLFIAWRQRAKPDPALLLIGLLGVVGTVVLLVTLSFPRVLHCLGRHLGARSTRSLFCTSCNVLNTGVSPLDRTSVGKKSGQSIWPIDRNREYWAASTWNRVGFWWGIPATLREPSGVQLLSKGELPAMRTGSIQHSPPPRTTRVG